MPEASARAAHPRRRLHPDRLEPRSASTSAADPSRTSRPPSIATTRVQTPSSRSVLCSAISSAVPPAASRRSAASPTSRVPPGRAGPSARRGRGGAAASRGSRRSRRAAPGRRTVGRDRGREVLDARAAPARRASASTVSATSRPEVHRPERDLLEDASPRSADRCVFGFWKPRSRSARELVRPCPAIGLRHRSSRPGARRRSTPGASARRDEAQRRLAGVVRPDEPDDLAVGERSGRRPSSDDARIARVAVRDAAQLEHRPRSRGSGRTPAEAPVSRRRRRPGRERPAATGRRRWAADPPGAPEQVSPARPPERPRLEREAALLDLGQRGQDHRPRQRQDAAEAGAEAALGVEAARPLRGLDAAPARPSPAPPRASRARRRRAGGERPRRSRSTTNARGSVVSPNSAERHRQARTAGRSTWAAKSTPSAWRRTARRRTGRARRPG